MSAVYEGPFDREPWPEQLAAHVVDPRGERRIHGYAVRGDLVHHGVADVAWLALRGELPTAQQRAALTVAVAYLAPIHVGEAPAHAAVLARLTGARPSAVIATAATGLAEQGRSERESLAPWSAPPATAIEVDPSPEAVADHAWLVEQTRTWFGAEHALPEAPVLTRVATAHAILHRLGITDALAIEAVAVWARLLVVIAESQHVKPGAVRDYPARLPDYQYVDATGSSK